MRIRRIRLDTDPVVFVKLMMPGALLVREKSRLLEAKDCSFPVKGLLFSCEKSAIVLEKVRYSFSTMYGELVSGKSMAGLRQYIWWIRS